ncbi:hypothetical protein H7F51_02915 [Novosphingobium flavum]|uniref:Porin n=1 Tax=Novosphingobium flavum TaxID=1778672 RepID=A0A7X1KKE4_9SPHN|nr:hypothetical protein [Novosphingobium flavum]
MLSAAVVALALPSAVLAFTSNFDLRETNLAAPAEGSLIPATVDPEMARSIRIGALGRGQMFRFTPAGSTNRADRAVTVAVRVDPATARAISVGKPIGDAPLSGGAAALRIASTAYSLGVSRGYQSFTLPGTDKIRADMPELSAFRLHSGVPDEPSRLNARISLDEREKTGRAPRTLEGSGEQTVDVGGSYSLTRNLDVTAGVRYSQDRDRLLPQSDATKDNQAVYVGTQFRF